MSVTQCQRLNVSDSMSETQYQRLNITDWMSESDLLIWSCICPTPCTSVYGWILVKVEIVDLWCLVFHPWTAARPSVNADRLLMASMSWAVILCALAQITVGPVRNTGKPSLWDSWWWYNNCCWADIWVTEGIVGSLGWYDDHQVNTGRSEWIILDCICYIWTCTKCALTHAWQGDHSNTHSYCDDDKQVDAVEKVLRIEKRRVWRSNLLVCWDRLKINMQKSQRWLWKQYTMRIGRKRAVVWCRNDNLCTCHSGTWPRLGNGHFI